MTGNEAHFDGRRLVVLVHESDTPETPRPWFEVQRDGVRWKGQAIAPPTVEEDGRLRFVVDAMTPQR